MGALPLLLGTVFAIASQQNPVKPGPVQVFILAGQSNMEGQAQIGSLLKPDCKPGEKTTTCNQNGTLAWLVKNKPAEFGFAASGNHGNHSTWTVRDDVWMWTNENAKEDANVSGQGSFGPLVPGFGFGGLGYGRQMGPEYGFGVTVGNALQEQVLLIKTAWGGKTLAVDFRSPSAAKKSGGAVGFYWNKMISDVKSVLADLDTLFPQYDKAKGYAVKGVLWDQGWNDGCSEQESKDYESNLVDFIQDVRVEWGADLKFSIPVSSFGGLGSCHNPSNQCNQPDRRHWVVAAQNAVANSTQHPELHGGVAARDPGPYYIPLCEQEYQTSGCPSNATRWSPANMIYHWNQNAYTYWHMGRLGGEGMLSLLPPSSD